MRRGDYVETVGIGNFTTWSKLRGVIIRKEGNSVSIKWDTSDSEVIITPDKIKLVKRTELFELWKKKNKYNRIVFLRKEFNLTQLEARKLYKPNPVSFPFKVKKHFFELI